MGKDFCANSKHKKTEVVTLILDEVDIKIRDITRYEEGYFMMTEVNSSRRYSNLKCVCKK